MKQRLLLSCFLIVFSSRVCCQEKLPVLRSEKKLIHINFNGTVMDWYLQPELKPDVFSVGSTLKDKKVQFHTGTDSISFQVEAGRQYDFIILLNSQTECYTRIAAMDDPPFLHRTAGVSLLIAAMLLLFLLYCKRRSLPVKLLLLAGV